MALDTEAAEFPEIFHWLTDEQSHQIVNDEKEMGLIRQETVRVMICLVREKMGAHPLFEWKGG